VMIEKVIGGVAMVRPQEHETLEPRNN
jgi:hypothetical protein